MNPDKADSIINLSKLKSLEVLRFIAASMVVFAHQPAVKIPIFEWFFGSKLFCGSIGVDIFFVISGYVIANTTKTLNGGFCDTKRFLQKRLLRILPLYWFMTILAFGPTEWDRDYFVKSLLLFPDSNHGFNPAINVAWTLQFELYFYIAFSVGVLLKHQFSAVALIFLFSIFACLKYGFYFGSPIILEFCYGVAIWWFVNKSGERLLKINNKILYAMMGLATIMLLLSSLGHDSNLTQYSATIIPRVEINFGQTLLPRYFAWGIPAWLFVFSAILLENKIKWRLWSLGKYTYSMYLWQGFPIPFAMSIFDRTSLLGMLTYFVQLGLITVLSYNFIENPYNSWKKSSKHFDTQG